MDAIQAADLEHFLYGLPSNVDVSLGIYDPFCMDFDGLDQVWGIYVHVTHQDMEGGLWHVGIHLVKLQPGQDINRLYQSVVDVNARCSWFDSLTARN